MTVESEFTNTTLKWPYLQYIDYVIGASRSELHTSELNQDFSVYIYIYLLYVILYIPIFYFNDLQIWTIHVHALYVMLYREIRKGELRRHKNKERQSYSDNVLCIVSLAHHLDPMV